MKPPYAPITKPGLRLPFEPGCSHRFKLTALKVGRFFVVPAHSDPHQPQLDAVPLILTCSGSTNSNWISASIFPRPTLKLLTLPNYLTSKPWPPKKLTFAPPASITHFFAADTLSIPTLASPTTQNFNWSIFFGRQP